MDSDASKRLPLPSKASTYTRAFDMFESTDSFGVARSTHDLEFDRLHNPSTSEGTETLLDPSSNLRPVHCHPAGASNQWRPGVFNNIPWPGLFALGFTISSMAASIVVLFASNNQLVTGWTIQPTVLLALASATANLALKLAFAQGVTISWWYKALNGGTIGDLHRYWSFGSSP